MADHRITVRAQLFSLLGLLLILMSVSVGLALQYLETQNSRSKQLTDVVAERVIVAQEWITSLLESARHTRNVLILDDQALIKKELLLLDAEIEERAQHLQRLNSLSDTPETKLLFDRIVDSRAIYLPLEQEYVRMIEAQDYKAARLLLLTQTRPAQLDYVDKIYKYIEPARLELNLAAQQSKQATDEARTRLLVLLGTTLAFGAAVGWWVTRGLLRQLGGEPRVAVEVANRIAQGERDVDVAVAPGDQASLMYALRAMAQALTRSHLGKERSDWIKSGLADLSLITRREVPPPELAQALLSYMVQRLGAAVGAVYIFQARSEQLEQVAALGLRQDAKQIQSFTLGQGLVGQAASSKQARVISPLPSGYLHAASGTGAATPEALLLLPLHDLNGLVGLLEVGSFQGFNELALEFINLAAEGLGIGLGSALSRQRNQELLSTTQAQSEELQTQQEELAQTNDELREHAQALDAQRRELDQRNAELRDSSAEIEWRAQELERVSQYKSEFLANMSHELRTPLNSMLMLSSLLRDNREQTLTDKQLKFAAAIHAAGQDLLSLINDILDLSKIEAGQVEYLIEAHPLDALFEPLRQMFLPMAQQKGLSLQFSSTDDVPNVLRLDLRRIQQVLKNLLSNALKFTEHGQVELSLARLENHNSPLKQATLAFAVTDSGIGIAADKQALVFEAFKQADGGISRRYGGTGLGLSISRQLALGMHGQLSLSSTPGQGSTFTLFLPLTPQAPAAALPPLPEATHAATNALTNSSLNKAPNETSAQVLIVEDNPTEAFALSEILGSAGLATRIAASGAEALRCLQQGSFDALILDLGLGDMQGEDLLQQIRSQYSPAALPVLVHSARSQDRSLERSLRHLAQVVIVKGEYSAARVRLELQKLLGADAKASELLAPEVKLAPEAESVQGLPGLQGRTVLLADDDIRNVFAIGSLLSYHGVRLIEAENGREALDMLAKHPEIELILMDIMMPEMDGYTAIRQIRSGQVRLEATHMPIIAMTAKTMPGDRELCLQAGASDYIAKPLDNEKLLSMMQVWLGESGGSPDSHQASHSPKHV